MGLPGSVLKLRADSVCDDHQDRKAVVHIQGETDSFGFESLFMCQECYDIYLASLEDDALDECEWCGTTTTCKPTRDYDEGMHGPVYQVCETCRKKQIEQCEEEYNR